MADSGPGIHPDDLPHVFDRYFQTNQPDKPAEGGTGIGLDLCQEYIRLFDGDIAVESTLGNGAIFRVSFPVTLTDSQPVPVPATEKREREAPVTSLPNTGGPKPAILVVEDNPELQDYISLILSAKYDVAVAGNGKVALDRIAAHNYRLIVSDLMMPVMDGYQLLEQLKSGDDTRHIPVIMLTARAEARDKLKALRIGVDDYLLKPFDDEELVARIDNLLKNQSARNPEATPPPAMSAADCDWLEAFEMYLQQNLSSDILSIPLLAEQFAMSESTLLRQLKRLTGLTPQKYLIEMRLDKARKLLENRAYNTVAQVAYEVGYLDVKVFSRVFRQRFGKLPSEMLV
ncbi:MAG: response regulator [Saprospiraceae bacterium]|nr:response regulator [Saprospiraceae bacterium]